MAQQTAVEWLQELYNSRPAYEQFIMDEEFEQAKQMEKEQITQAHLFGLLRPIEMEATKQAEQYYNENYNK
jgi:hypothetical protein